MSAEILEKYFDIKPERTIQDGKKIRYAVHDSLYTLIPVKHVGEQVLIELYEMSEHMAKYGDHKVSLFVASKDGKYLVTHQEMDYVLLYNHHYPPSRKINVGRSLALFHERGKNLNAEVVEMNQVGQWIKYWITRLEQMERVWSGMLREQTGEEFEKVFIETFPYYLGLCENAIQYVTDTDMDEQPLPFDMGTICHRQFYDELWDDEIKDPFDWVFDHPSRDIAEWIRNCYFRNPRAFQPEISNFIQGYESITPLSPFAWRLVYARLLFPLHYFKCVEDYYLSNSQWTQKQLEERLTRYIRDSKDYELFLGHFYHIVDADTMHLPAVDWLL
jgi:spore coat protein YutH